MQNNLTTEEAGKIAEELYGQKYALIDADIDKVIKEIDTYIAHSDSKGAEKLCELFSNRVFRERFESDKRVAYISVAVDIYSEEKRRGRGKNIFNSTGNVENIIYLIREIKYQLWRLEFAEDDSAKEWICYNSQEGDIGCECISELVWRYSVDKVGMLLSLAAVYAADNMEKYAEYILEYLRMKLPADSNMGDVFERFKEQYGL